MLADCVRRGTIYPFEQGRGGPPGHEDYKYTGLTLIDNWAASYTWNAIWQMEIHLDAEHPVWCNAIDYNTSYPDYALHIDYYECDLVNDDTPEVLEEDLHTIYSLPATTGVHFAGPMNDLSTMLVKRSVSPYQGSWYVDQIDTSTTTVGGHADWTGGYTPSTYIFGMSMDSGAERYCVRIGDYIYGLGGAWAGVDYYLAKWYVPQDGTESGGPPVDYTYFADLGWTYRNGGFLTGYFGLTVGVDGYLYISGWDGANSSVEGTPYDFIILKVDPSSLETVDVFFAFESHVFAGRDFTPNRRISFVNGRSVVVAYVNGVVTSNYHCLIDLRDTGTIIDFLSTSSNTLVEAAAVASPGSDAYIAVHVDSVSADGVMVFKATGVPA